MTLDELQAEFPWGSRWDPSGPIIVLGWDAENGSLPVICRHEATGILGHYWPGAHERIPDPTPCPITEPVTVEYLPQWKNTGRWAPLWLSTAITVHPDGRYTWEGGPT